MSTGEAVQKLDTHKLAGSLVLLGERVGAHCEQVPATFHIDIDLPSRTDDHGTLRVARQFGPDLRFRLH